MDAFVANMTSLFFIVAIIRFIGRVDLSYPECVVILMFVIGETPLL